MWQVSVFGFGTLEDSGRYCTWEQRVSWICWTVALLSMTKAPSKIRQNSPFKTSCFLGRTCKTQHLQMCWKCTRRLGCGQPWTTPRIGCQILCRTGLLTLIYQSLYPRWSRWSPRITYIGCPSCSKSGSDTHLPTGSADTWPAYPERVAKTKPFNMLQLECQKSACFSPRLIMLGTLNGCIPSQTQHQCNPQTSTNCMNPGWRPLRGRRATPGPNGSATCCRTQIWDRRGVAGCHGMISDSARGCKGWNLKTSLDSMLGKKLYGKTIWKNGKTLKKRRLKCEVHTFDKS